MQENCHSRHKKDSEYILTFANASQIFCANSTKSLTTVAKLNTASVVVNGSMLARENYVRMAGTDKTWAKSTAS